MELRTRDMGGGTSSSETRAPEPESRRPSSRCSVFVKKEPRTSKTEVRAASSNDTIRATVGFSPRCLPSNAAVRAADRKVGGRRDACSKWLWLSRVFGVV